jgi:hypothetical protein
VEGERLDTLERMVVSPATGIFAAVAGLGLGHVHVSAGTTIGFVQAGATLVPVVAPFDGELVALDAVHGERLTCHQRVGWLRCP